MAFSKITKPVQPVHYSDARMEKSSTEVTETVCDHLVSRSYTKLTITTADPKIIAVIEAAFFAALNKTK